MVSVIAHICRAAFWVHSRELRTIAGEDCKYQQSGQSLLQQPSIEIVVFFVMSGIVARHSIGYIHEIQLLNHGAEAQYVACSQLEYTALSRRGQVRIEGMGEVPYGF